MRATCAAAGRASSALPPLPTRLGRYFIMAVFRARRGMPILVVAYMMGRPGCQSRGFSSQQAMKTPARQVAQRPPAVDGEAPSFARALYDD